MFILTIIDTYGDTKYSANTLEDVFDGIRRLDWNETHVVRVILEKKE